MRRLFAVLEKRPNISFVVILILLFGVIFVATQTRKPKTATEEVVKAPLTSAVAPVSEAGFVTTTAKVKKSGVVDIVAVTGGVVQSVNVRVGQRVSLGTTLVTLTNDYGVNAARLGTAKTKLESNFTERVFKLQKEINDREKKIAKNDDTLSHDQEKRDLKNLKLELERLELGRETAKLDVAIANANDAVLRPKSLAVGTVEFIGVRSGETVSPGTLIATIHGEKSVNTLVATLPDTTARFVNRSGIATLVLGDKHVPLSQGYLSQSENSLGLRSFTIPVSDEIGSQLTDSEFITLLLPLQPGAGQFFVPIDTILSGEQGISVLVLDADHTVQEKNVVLGEVIGSFVLVKSGLTENDQVLLNRGLAPGQTVTVVQ